MQARQRDAAGADLQRDDVADQAERQRDRGEHDEGHRAPSLSSRLKISGCDQRVLGHDQLQPHERELDRREREEGERRGDVEQADRLVVGARRALDPGAGARPGRRG